MKGIARHKLELARNTAGCHPETLGRSRYSAEGDVPPWPQARTMRHHLLSLPAALVVRPGQYGAPTSLSDRVVDHRGVALTGVPRTPLRGSGAKDDHNAAAARCLCIARRKVASPPPPFIEESILPMIIREVPRVRN